MDSKKLLNKFSTEKGDQDSLIRQQQERENVIHSKIYENFNSNQPIKKNDSDQEDEEEKIERRHGSMHSGIGGAFYGIKEKKMELEMSKKV